MAHFWGILTVNVKFYSMNKTLKNTPKYSGYKRIRRDRPKERQTV